MTIQAEIMESYFNNRRGKLQFSMNFKTVFQTLKILLLCYQWIGKWKNSKTKIYLVNCNLIIDESWQFKCFISL